MHPVTLYQLDAFTDGVFSGNPAAVCLPPRPLTDAAMQAIAEENNLSETAFLWPVSPGHWQLRWFTPACEVDLCGHATLASAQALLECEGAEAPVRFATRSGELTVYAVGDGRLRMDFPARPPQPAHLPEGVAEALGCRPREVLSAGYLLLVLDTETQVRNLQPDFGRLRTLRPAVNVIVTAASDGPWHFVSRFFAAASGIDEDPVTGSAHCLLAPYWAKQLGRSHMLARQVSARGGELECTLAGDRVLLTGRACLYLRGQALLPESAFADGPAHG